MITRQQELLSHALENIHKVEQKEKKVQTIYGGMCHKFPVLIRTCGLCQALAFIESKAGTEELEQKTDERKKAHSLLREHICSILSKEGFVTGDASCVCLSVAKLPLTQYMLATRLLLKAWVFYKRFAVSILKVEDASVEEDSDIDEGALNATIS